MKQDPGWLCEIVFVKVHECPWAWEHDVKAEKGKDHHLGSDREAEQESVCASKLFFAFLAFGHYESRDLFEAEHDEEVKEDFVPELSEVEHRELVKVHFASLLVPDLKLLISSFLGIFLELKDVSNLTQKYLYQNSFVPIWVLQPSQELYYKQHSYQLLKQIQPANHYRSNTHYCQSAGRVSRRAHYLALLPYLSSISFAIVSKDVLIIWRGKVHHEQRVVLGRRCSSTR